MAADSPRAPLAVELDLDGAARAFIDALPAAKRKKLEAQAQAAAEAQHRELSAALDEAVGFVPRPLRNTARKLVLGG